MIKLKDFADRERWDRRARAGASPRTTPALVVLAGFMRVVGAAMVARFHGRIINVHPALLPLFPGTDGPAQALRGARARERLHRARRRQRRRHRADHRAGGRARAARTTTPTACTRASSAPSTGLLPAVIDGVARGAIALGAEVRVAARCFDDACCAAVSGARSATDRERVELLRRHRARHRALGR